MPSLIYVLLAGLAGGVARGLVGYIKYRGSYKNVPFQWGYFSFSVGVSGAVGVLAAWITKDLGINFLGLSEITPALAIIIGYAGGDFIDNLIKIIAGKSTLYQLPPQK